MTTLNELVALIGGGRRRAAADACTCRCGRSGWPARVCEAVCAPLGIEPPIYRRRVDFFTKSRAFDITRARDARSASRRRSACATASPHAGLVPRPWMAVNRSDGPCHPIGKAQEQLFAPGTSSRAKYAALVVGRPGSRRAAEVRARRHARAGVARRARPGAAQGAVPAAARLVRPQRRLRAERRAAASAQDSHRRQRRRSTTTACSTPRARRTAASGSATACSSAATRSCRARTATSSSATARTSASTASCSRPAASRSARTC